MFSMQMSSRIRIYKTFRFKIVAVFSVTFAVISFIAGLLLYRAFSSALIQQDDLRLTARANILLDKLELSPLIVPLPDKNEFIRIRYYGPAFDKILFESNGFDFSSVSKNGDIVQVGDYRVTRVSINVDNSDSEWIELSLASEDLITQKLSALRIEFGAIVLVAIIISSIVSYPVAGMLLRPIQKIIRVADEVDLSKKPELIPSPDTNDEISQLIDTLNRMLERIGQTMKTQNLLFASAAHELRTPLSVMQTELEVQRLTSNKDPEFDEMIKSQLEEVIRLKRLVEDLLTMSQSQNGKPKLKEDRVLIRSFVSDTLAQLKHLVDEKTVINLSGAELTVVCDATKTRSAIINLVENALKYNVPNSPIDIGISSSGNQFVITVANRTMQSIDVEKVKGEFYQGDLMNKGYGLGLWIANRLIEIQGGELLLEFDNGQFIAKCIMSSSLSFSR